MVSLFLQHVLKAVGEANPEQDDRSQETGPGLERITMMSLSLS